MRSELFNLEEFLIVGCEQNRGNDGRSFVTSTFQVESHNTMKINTKEELDSEFQKDWRAQGHSGSGGERVLGSKRNKEKIQPELL